MASVLARAPVALAKSRTCRGLTTATLMLLAASVAAMAAWYPPVASSTTRLGASAASLVASAACAFGSFPVDQASPDERTCTSSWFFETSIPTNTMLAPEQELSAQPCLADASSMLGQLFGLVGDKEGAATKALCRSFRPRRDERPAAPGTIVTAAAVIDRLDSTYKTQRHRDRHRRSKVDPTTRALPSTG